MALAKGRSTGEDVITGLITLIKFVGICDVAFDMELEVLAYASSRVVEDVIEAVGKDGVDIKEHDTVELGPGCYAKFCHHF